MKSKKLVKTAVIVGILVILAAVLSFVVFSRGAGEEMKIYFYPLGNNRSGDSCIIKYGDTEVLIDAGANSESREIIISKVKEYCTDGVLDYLIVTHPDFDHLAGLVNENGLLRFFEKNSDKYSIGTLIDFDTAEDDTVDKETRDAFKTLFTKDDEEDEEEAEKKKTGYGPYSRLRNKLAGLDAPYTVEGLTEGEENSSDGDDSKENKKVIQNYYTASQCYWKKRGLSAAPKEGAQNVFSLGSGANAPKLTILYNDYNLNPIQSKNMTSVCCLIEYGEHSFLFTGDLEATGEKKLISNNKDIIPEKVTLYKAGHHGSKTSSCQEFIDHIKPQHVVFTCAAGSYEYGFGSDETRFPAKEVTDRIFTYTDHMYIISECKSKSEYVQYHGNVTFTSNGTDLDVVSSKNFQIDDSEEGEDKEKPESGVPKLIQDTEWYKANRNDVFNVYTLYGDNHGESNCTLIKYGHTELLIDCGMNRKGSQQPLIDKVLKYCNDGVLEYAIVTTAQIESMGGFIGDTDKSNGIFDQLDIGMLIEFGASNFYRAGLDESEATAFNTYNEKREIIRGSGTKVYTAKEVLVNDDYNGKISITPYFSINILDSMFYTMDGKTHNEDDYSVCSLVTFREKKMLFLGDLTDSAGAITYLMKNNKEAIKNVDFYRAANYGGKSSYTKTFLKHIKPKTVVVDCMAGMILTERAVTYPNIDHMQNLVDVAENNGVYLTGMLKKQQNSELCGDITYSITSKEVDGKRVVDAKIVGEEIKLVDTEWWQNQDKDGDQAA